MYIWFGQLNVCEYTEYTIEAPNCVSCVNAENWFIRNIWWYKSTIVDFGMPTEEAYSSGHPVLSHFGTCMCSNVETNLSWTYLFSGLLSFEHPSVLLFCSFRISLRSRVFTCNSSDGSSNGFTLYLNNSFVFLSPRNSVRSIDKVIQPFGCDWASVCVHKALLIQTTVFIIPHIMDTINKEIWLGNRRHVEGRHIFMSSSRLHVSQYSVLRRITSCFGFRYNKQF